LERIPITREGYEALKNELEYLKKVERPANIKSIEEARAHGDLSENADYHAAKEEQGLNEMRIKEFEEKIASAEIVEKSQLGGSVKVRLNSTVKIKDIVSQINKYPDLQEAILTAINTEAFGFDTGEKLITLIDQTIEVTKIPRISFGSIHPWSINEEFLNYYKKILPLKRLVNFFHVPIQSGSNKILNLMKRGYTREEIMEKLRSIERLNKYALIATDVIVGFLDETDKDFQDTYDFLEKSPISKFHIFRFSNRNNTSAHYMARNLKEPSNGIKMKRAKILAKLGKEKYEKFLKKNVGRTSTVLFLNNKFDGYQEALLDNQLQIYIKVIKPIQLTQLYEAKILEYKKGKLFGRII